MSTVQDAMADAQLASHLAMSLRYHRGLRHGALVGLLVGCCTTALAMWLVSAIAIALRCA